MALGKESKVDKQERGVEICLLQVIFYLRDFHLRARDRSVPLFSFDTFASFTHSLIRMEHFSGRKVSTIHVNVLSV